MVVAPYLNSGNTGINTGIDIIQRQYKLRRQMIENSRREDIIIELGQQNIRVGLVGDKVPRKTIKASQYFKNPSTFSSPDFAMLIEQLLYNIFFSYINCSSQGKTVVLLEKVYTDRRIIEQMASIMFRKLKIERVELALSCVTPLYLTGRYTGLVVSAGASSTEFMPIFEGFPLFTHFQCLRTGTLSLHSMIRDEIALLNRELPMDTLKKITEDEITETIKNPHCSATASSEPVTVAVRAKLRIKWIPDKANLNIFFGNHEAEEYNIAFTFLEVLNRVPENCLDALCKNVVLAGGFWRIKGMQKMFKSHISKLIDIFPKLKTLEVRNKLSFVSWSFNPSEVAWIGCSIGASIRNIEHLSLKKSEYLEEGFTEKVMEAYFCSG